MYDQTSFEKVKMQLCILSLYTTPGFNLQKESQRTNHCLNDKTKENSCDYLKINQLFVTYIDTGGWWVQLVTRNAGFHGVVGFNR